MIQNYIKPNWGKYRKAPSYRINHEKWRVMRASLVYTLMSETLEKNSDPRNIHDIHYGDVDEVEWLYTPDEIEEYVDIRIIQALEE